MVLSLTLVYFLGWKVVHIEFFIFLCILFLLNLNSSYKRTTLFCGMILNYINLGVLVYSFPLKFILSSKNYKKMFLEAKYTFFDDFSFAFLVRISKMRLFNHSLNSFEKFWLKYFVMVDTLIVSRKFILTNHSYLPSTFSKLEIISGKNRKKIKLSNFPLKVLEKLDTHLAIEFSNPLFIRKLVTSSKIFSLLNLKKILVDTLELKGELSKFKEITSSKIKGDGSLTKLSQFEGIRKLILGSNRKNFTFDYSPDSLKSLNIRLSPPPVEENINLSHLKLEELIISRDFTHGKKLIVYPFRIASIFVTYPRCGSKYINDTRYVLRSKRYVGLFRELEVIDILSEIAQEERSALLLDISNILFENTLLLFRKSFTDEEYSLVYGIERETFFNNSR